MKQSYVTVTDQFCGAGGSSIGATAAGAELRLALNHWQLAIETHNTNFPNALHDCTDISACDPRRYPSTDILITSPECTNHSLAKGTRKPAQYDLFGNGPDPAEERSRATMWDVPRFAEYHKYNAIIVENVVDARHWVNWTAWLLAMRQLGYDFKVVYFNSMHAWPTPQSRDRMYVVFWRKGNKKPELDIRPVAHCHKCGKDIQAQQCWKNVGRRWGRFGDQYVYRCPECSSEVRPYYYAAASAIDWSLDCPRIGDRERPLKEKTLNRIRIGLKKFAGQGFLADIIHTPRDDGGSMLYPLTNPQRTILAQSTHALIMPPFTMQLSHGGDDVESRVASRSVAVTDAMATQTTRQDVGVVVPPFMAKLYGTSEVESLDGPMGTQTANVHHALIVPYYSNGQATDTSEALPTITTVDRHALAVPPFILGYYTRVSGVQAAVSGIDEALPTQSAQPRHYLVQPSEVPAVEDCGFRMLQPHEIQKAMAFPESYVVLGTKRERVKQLGNAVTPPVMQILLERVIGSLM